MAPESPLLCFLPSSPRGRTDLAPPTPSSLDHTVPNGGFLQFLQAALPRCGGETTAVFYFMSGFPGGSAGKESACNAGDLVSIPGLGRFPWRRERLPTPVFWPWGHKVSDTSERLSLSLFMLSRVACGISVPRPGIEPEFPALEAPSLNPWTTREVPTAMFS